MNVKRILLIGLILVAVVASLSFVSADNSVNVGGIDFNIPDGYIEIETKAIDHENVSYPTNEGNIEANVSVKVFKSGDDIIAYFVYEFDSPDDAKNVRDYDKETYNLTRGTVNGHDGIYHYEDGVYEFGYCKDNYYITVDGTDESLLGKVVPK